MAHEDLQKTIETAFEARGELSFSTKGEVRDAVETALDLLDSGKAARMASRSSSKPMSSISSASSSTTIFTSTSASEPRFR